MKQVGLALALLVIAVFLLMEAGRGASYNLHHPLPPTTVTCQEDEPCWNCSTMGNHICGSDR